MKIIFVGPSSKMITGQSFAFKMAAESVDGARILEYDSSILGNLIFSYKFLTSLLFNKCDVVYFTSSRSYVGFLRDFFIINLSRIFRLKIVNHLHGSDFKSFRDSLPGFLRFILDKTYIKIDRSIVLCEQMQEQYECYDSMRLDIVPNFFDNNIIYTCKEKSDPSVCLNVLYLSNLMASKGVLDVIKGCSLLRKEGYVVKLRLAGSYIGDHICNADELEKLVNSEIDPEYDSYVGVVVNPDKANILAWAHVMCLPSYYPTEAQPISLIEGMAAGCFLITSNIGYISSITNSAECAIVPANSCFDISSALKSYVVSGKYREISIHNQELARINFSLRAYKNRLGYIFKAVSS